MTTVEAINWYIAQDRTAPSFWRRVGSSLMEGGQRKADVFVSEYLRTHAEYKDRPFGAGK